MKSFWIGMIGIVVGLLLIGCDVSKNSDQIQRKQQEQLSLRAAQQVGMPAITHFQEKRMLKMILELRDTEIKTITYIVDLNGRTHKLCDSVGFGFPYATQFTNPMRVAGGMDTPSTGNVAIPQADPNGLFSPVAADGTWVMCLNMETKKISPVYVEPRVIVSPFALDVR